MALTPSAQNLYLGAGSVYFDRLDADGNSTGLRHLGNVDKFGITTSVEVKEKKNAMDGLRATYAEVPIGSAADISMEITEFTKENLALAFIGQDSALTQSAVATVTDQAVGPAVAGDVELDKWYEMGCFDPTVTAVKQGATTLNASAYTIEASAGLIKLNSSYTGSNKAVAGTLITWSGSIPAIVAGDNRWIVQALSTASIKGHLKYVSAPNQTMGERMMVDVWLCGLNPDGEVGLITEDFGSFTLKGKAYADTTKSVGEQYFRAVNLKKS